MTDDEKVLFDRMAALVRDAAGPTGIAPVSAVEAEARAIAALLPGFDEKEAEKIYIAWSEDKIDTMKEAIVIAIKRGRELERRAAK